MVWGCFSVNGTGNIQIIKSLMNVVKYKDILGSNVQESVPNHHMNELFNKTTIPSTYLNL